MKIRGSSLILSFIMTLSLSIDFAQANVFADLGLKGDQSYLEEGAWPMVGANPERTSWTSEEVRGDLNPIWFKVFEPYISQKVQVIAANDMLYISTARGLYALDEETGEERWIYPTELPLGNSPTIVNGVAYVGGFDRKIHAINAHTGEGLWTFDEALAGYHTNPLVVDDKIYAGNRDGFFYAIYAEGDPHAGSLAWKFKTGGPILVSAAYKDGVVFFASNDSHAYALDSQTGGLVWKSAKLPGAGFHSWWPVIYRGRVIFSGSNNYRHFSPPDFGKPFTEQELEDLYPNRQSDPSEIFVGLPGYEPGDWASGTLTIDMSKPNTTENGSTQAVTEYFEAKPWRRTYFVLDQATGNEVIYDFDKDGKPEYAPILWVGTQNGNRYPPVVGSDGVLYQANNFMSDPWHAGGFVSGWKMDTPFISVPLIHWNAVDEPSASAAGGNLIYWNLCCDRRSLNFDITQPGTYQVYFNWGLETRIPGYNIRNYSPPDYQYEDPFTSFGGANGIYGFHADTNPPIPYKGKVFMHRSNALIAFGSGSSSSLPMAETVAPPETDVSALGQNYLHAQLEQEIQKMLDAGHMRPGYFGHGLFHGKNICGDILFDYWHNPSETIYTLIGALPHLPEAMQQQVKEYLQNEFTLYPPYEYNHIGWREGAAREIFDLPPEVENELVNYPPQPENEKFKTDGGWSGTGVWGRNPYMFYALWKYADLFGDARAIYNVSRERLESPPSDDVLINMPNVHNAFIAGYLGYLELEKLAGYPESSHVKYELNHLLQLRADSFTKDSAYASKLSLEGAYCRTLNIANNFMFLVPELGKYLRENALSKVEDALAEYYELAPYWFVTLSEEGFAENAINPLYDAHSIFMAKAQILQEPGDELEKYLDVPGFDRGDLYYIQKLVALFENQGFSLEATPSIQNIEPGDVAKYAIDVKFTGGFSDTVTLSATSPSPEILLSLSPKIIISPGGPATLTVTDTHSVSSTDSYLYSIPITAVGGEVAKSASVILLINGFQYYLPFVEK